MDAPFQARPSTLGPSHIPTASSSSSPTPAFNAPTPEYLAGQWFMTASSSTLWQNGKHSISVVYTPSGSAAGVLDDVTTSFAEGSSSSSSSSTSKPSTTKGVNSPNVAANGAGGAGVYTWRGTGWLRMISTTWEVIGWGVVEGQPVLVTLAQKTMFSPTALSVYWRRSEGMREEMVQAVAEVLKGLGDESLAAEVEKWRAIPQRGGG